MRVENILNSDDTVHNSFYVTGSTDGTAVFGSFNTGSVLAVSGTAFMTSMHVQYSGTNQDTNVGPRDYIFGVDTSANSPKIFLESAAVAGKGRKIVVKDTGNNANSNNIKITGSTAGDLIEYGVEALVTSNKGSKTLVSDGVSKWFVIGDV
jgi:3D (Asp-Asp-Asp) domain-containing protein